MPTDEIFSLKPCQTHRRVHYNLKVNRRMRFSASIFYVHFYHFKRENYIIRTKLGLSAWMRNDVDEAHSLQSCHIFEKILRSHE